MIAVGRPGRAETGSLKPSPLIPSAGFRVCLPKIASGLAQMPRWAILSGRPAAEVERREILLEGLIDMGSRALPTVSSRLNRTRISSRTRVCPSAPLSTTVSHCASSRPSGRTIRPPGLI